jgi:anaerobic ribonucleoside-triphosphate reductase activating protein
MTPDALPFSAGESIGVEELANCILSVPDIEGLTLSGGEPFAQAQGLAALVSTVRQERDLGVIVYTGHLLRNLRDKAISDSGIAALLACTDLLIDGPYEPKRNTGQPMRGSENQQLHLLTERYRQNMDIYASGQSRQIEVHLTRHDAMLVGIPSGKQLTMWQQFKQSSA